jgi:hypothetical protein
LYSILPLLRLGRRDPGAGAGEFKDERGQARLYEMSEKALVLWAKE